MAARRVRTLCMVAMALLLPVTAYAMLKQQWALAGAACVGILAARIIGLR